MITRTCVAGALVAALSVFSIDTLVADVRTSQRTRIEFGGTLGRVVNFFGGRAAKEGVTSTVAVRGDRKATTNEQTGQIVDLAEEKVYELDIRRKTYKVTTFAELRRRMEEAQKRAAEEAAKQEGREERDPSQAQEEPQMEVDVDARETGERRTINGFDTRQVILTVTLRQKDKTLEQGGGLVATTDLWLAPTVAGMSEIVEFDRRYAEQLYGGMIAGASAEQLAAALAMYPMLKEALGRAAVEGAKLEGTAVLTTLTMDAVRSEEEVAAQAKAEESSPPSGGLGGLLGGLARRTARRDENQNPARTTFMTSTTEVLSVTSTVPASDVEIPAGFRED
jgi:hypothetical protein